MNAISHVAIIMDGNGRWALKRKKSRNYGHKKGLNNIINIIKYCKQKNIRFLTLYVFSLDNWKRSKKEVFFLFKLLETYLDKNLYYLEKNKIRINVIGETFNLKKNLVKKINSIKKKQIKNFKITVNLAFNYSSKAEIISSFNKLIKKNKKKKFSIKDLESCLYTSGMPDPEILIRTGGNNRLSDFLLWQLSYSELFFIKKFWPDFSTNDLDLVIKKYNKVKRNFGSIDE